MTLNENSSLSEITESISHINEVFLPSIKQKLASKTHFGAENTFNALIDNIALDKLGGKKIACGAQYTYLYEGSWVTGRITGIDFSPKFIAVYTPTGSVGYAIYVKSFNGLEDATKSFVNKSMGSAAYFEMEIINVASTEFSYRIKPVGIIATSSNVNWIAIE